MLTLIALTWSQNPEVAESNAWRNCFAWWVYMISLGLVVFELTYKSTRQTVMEMFTKLALIVVKPVFIVNG
jgi:hypothetical protein